MSDHSELKRLAGLVAGTKSLTIADDRLWSRRATGRAVLELFLDRDGLKTDNVALVDAIEHQCNWLQGLVGVDGKADALTMGAMIAKLRHVLAMHEVYARG